MDCEHTHCMLDECFLLGGKGWEERGREGAQAREGHRLVELYQAVIEPLLEGEHRDDRRRGV